MGTYPIVICLTLPLCLIWLALRRIAKALERLHEPLVYLRLGDEIVEDAIVAPPHRSVDPHFLVDDAVIQGRVSLDDLDRASGV